MRLRRWVAAVGVVGVAAGAAAVGVAWRPAIPAIAPPGRGGFERAAVDRGAVLAAIGDCAVCHTASGGRPYAGGRGVPTPFGTVFASNITPDAGTGIGGWPAAAFVRAMRDGVSRDGRHLYPVLPYPHFTRATDGDLGDLYAFLMTRAPVAQVTPPNPLPFPLNVRALLAGWNLLFLRQGIWQADPARDAQWNRGSYLVEAVAHCGACHSGRNVLGAEKAAEVLAGGEAEGWHAPALQAGAQPAHPWTEDELVEYLRTGVQARHGVAGGPMAAVTENLARVPEADVRAMAAYIVSLMPKGDPAAAARRWTPVTAAGPSAPDPAEAAFAGACGSCHGAQAPIIQAGGPSLVVSAAANAPTPQSAIRAVLHGIPWREGRSGPYMPAFGEVLTDEQVGALVAYVRRRYSGRAPWTDVEDEVAKARREGGPR